MVPAALHRFRPAPRARTLVREQCRPATASFRDWLRPDPHRLAASAARPKPAPPCNSGSTQPAAPPPVLAGNHAPTEIPPEFRGIVTNNPGIPNRPTEYTGQRPPYPWEMEQSHVEWVVINKLGRKFPEAWRYVVDEALKRGGLDHIKDKQQ